MEKIRPSKILLHHYPNRQGLNRSAQTGQQWLNTSLPTFPCMLPWNERDLLCLRTHQERKKQPCMVLARRVLIPALDPVAHTTFPLRQTQSLWILSGFGNIIPSLPARPTGFVLKVRNLQCARKSNAWKMDSPFELEDADLNIDDDSENKENLHPNIMAIYRMRIMLQFVNATMTF